MRTSQTCRRKKVWVSGWPQCLYPSPLPSHNLNSGSGTEKLIRAEKLKNPTQKSASIKGFTGLPVVREQEQLPWRYVTCDMRRVPDDRWEEVNLLSKFQLVPQSNFPITVIFNFTMSSFLEFMANSLKFICRTESVQQRKHWVGHKNN